jgi:His-Xaa-Ser system protein HxsD
MQKFLNETIEKSQFELLIDTKIFPKDIILKASYNFLDRGYFFFKYDMNENIILQFTKREDNIEEPKNIIADFSDELLSTLLRHNLEKENKEIREAIVTTAISNSLDVNNFISMDTNQQEQNEIDFDKDIDDILSEIENDPELKIDESEIENILKEIEEENKKEPQEPVFNIDLDAVKKAKDTFNK